jgi:hypothetical protein
MTASALATMWDRVSATQEAPPSWLVLTCAAVALAAVLPRQTWAVARNVVTIAHEGGHALTAVATGRRLSSIRLHSDTSGLTVSVGKPTGPGMVVTMAAGYLAPSVLGLAGVGLLSAGHVTALLWVSLGLLAAMLIAIRNLFGVLSVVVTGAAVFAVSWFATAVVQAAFAYALTWFLLIAGPRPVFELQTKRRRGGAPDSDADQLARLTGIPGIAWVAAFTLLTVAALLAGARWLLPPL